MIPALLRGENTVVAASTGSGKTLAYTLPMIHALKTAEAMGIERKVKLPVVGSLVCLKNKLHALLMS